MRRSPMPPGTKPLRRHKGLAPGGPIQRTPFKVKGAAEKRPVVVLKPIEFRVRGLSNPTPEVIEIVVRRDRRRCVVCGNRVRDGERGVSWAVHHRRPRGKGGSRLPDTHRPQNLVVVCGRDNTTACHGRIHRNEGNEARVNGWLISNNAEQRDPLLVPLLYRGALVYLDAIGGVHDYEAVSA